MTFSELASPAGAARRGSFAFWSSRLRLSTSRRSTFLDESGRRTAIVVGVPISSPVGLRHHRSPRGPHGPAAQAARASSLEFSHPSSARIRRLCLPADDGSAMGPPLDSDHHSPPTLAKSTRHCMRLRARCEAENIHVIPSDLGFKRTCA